MKHVILGAGQVSKVIQDNLVPSWIVYDKGGWEDIAPGECKGIECLHITIPYDDDFVDVVQKAVSVFKPETTVIHSTVKPGTTKKIGKDALYSPVLGRHADDFSKNAVMYWKFVAGKKSRYIEVSKSFGFRCEYWGKNTDELEYAKVMSTNYMYWNLVYQKNLIKDCEKSGYDFNQVYYRWNENYNHGIAKKHEAWKRPMYNRVDGPVGGHCLPNNIHLVDNEISFILRIFQEKKEILYYVTKG